jgi:hypothetical protein
MWWEIYCFFQNILHLGLAVAYAPVLHRTVFHFTWRFFFGGQNNHTKDSGNNQAMGQASPVSGKNAGVFWPLAASHRPVIAATGQWLAANEHQQVYFLDPPIYLSVALASSHTNSTVAGSRIHRNRTIQVHRKIRQCMYCMRLVIYTILVRWHVTFTAHRKLSYVGPPSLKLFCCVKASPTASSIN